MIADRVKRWRGVSGWHSAYVLRDLEHHVAAANKRVPRFPALEHSPQYHQGIRCCRPFLALRDPICLPQGPPTIFSRQERDPPFQAQTQCFLVKGEELQTPVQHTTDGERANGSLGVCSDLVCSQTEPQEFCFFDHAVRARAVFTLLLHRTKPQTS